MSNPQTAPSATMTCLSLAPSGRGSIRFSLAPEPLEPIHGFVAVETSLSRQFCESPPHPVGLINASMASIPSKPESPRGRET